MLFQRYILVILLSLSTQEMFGQFPVSQFSINTSACLNEEIQATNHSTNSNRYEWDLCQGDLSLQPLGSASIPIPNVTIPLGIDIVFDGTSWYGFITSRGSNSIIRYKYNSDFSVITEVTDLGNIGNLLNQPVEIKIVSDNGKWFGFVSNQSSSVSTSLITRIDFGFNLTNASPTGVSLIEDINFATDAGLDIIFNGSMWYLIYNQIGLGPTYKSEVIRLATLESIPTPSDRLVIPYADSPNLHDIKFIKQNDTFHAYAVADSPSKLVHINFQTDLFSTPSVEDISAVLPLSLNPYGVDGDYDNGQQFLFIMNDNGNIVRINLGDDLSNSPIDVSSLGNLGTFANTRKIRLVKDKTQWLGFSVNYFTGAIYKATFPQPVCQSPGVLTTTNIQLNFGQSGTKAISLRAFNDTVFDDQHKQIFISSFTAPELAISNLGSCIEAPVQFSLITDQPLNTVVWDFGDSNTSILGDPTHQYSSVGEYTVRLNVESTNGCQNFVEKAVKIYDSPAATFTLPTGLICTNNEFSFINNTLDNFDGNLTYEWLVNDVLESTARDFNYTFIAGGDHQVKLRTSIPGCSDEVSQTLLDVQIGPVVEFSYTGKCEDEVIVFANESSGSISGYQWDFDNGNSSGEINPSMVYSSIGAYDVTLSATGLNGCRSAITKLINIYSVPQPNFSLDLPPFSCAGSPSRFNDLTPPLPDSNLASWTWSFGDPSSSTATQQNPTHTYLASGDYTVSLGVTSNFGCSSSVQKAVMISEPPSVDFFNDPACLSQGTRFTDASSADVKAWLWSMQNSNYTSKNPTHTFNATGEFTVMLTVTGTNNCINQLSKPVQVPIPVAVNFNAGSTCATLSATFTELTAAGTDPAVSWSWDFNGQPGNGSPVQHTFPTVGTYPVKLSSTRASGCTYTVTKLIPIIPPPVAQFTVSTDAGAAPLAVGFTNLSTNASSFTWAFNDVANTTSSEFSPSFIFNDLGTYPVQLIASNSVGCSDTFVKSIQVVVPEMNAAVTDFELVPAGDGTWRATVTVLNKSNLAISNPEIFVDLSGLTQIKERLPITLQPNQSVTQSLSSNFVVSNLKYACAEVRLAEDLYDFDNQQCANLTTESVTILPYPNPVSDELVVNWINTEYNQLSIAIYNSAGQIMMQQQFNPTLPNLNQVKVDVSKLGQGIYYVSLSAGGKVSSYRVAIVR